MDSRAQPGYGSLDRRQGCDPNPQGMSPSTTLLNGAMLNMDGETTPPVRESVGLPTVPLQEEQRGRSGVTANRGEVPEVVDGLARGVRHQQGQGLQAVASSQGEALPPRTVGTNGAVPAGGDETEDNVTPTDNGTGMAGFMAATVAGLQEATRQAQAAVGSVLEISPGTGPLSYGSTGTFNTALSAAARTTTGPATPGTSATPPLFRAEDVQRFRSLQQQAPHLYPAESAPSSDGSGALPQDMVQAEVRRQLRDVVYRQQSEADALRARLQELQDRNRFLEQNITGPSPGYESSGWLRNISGWFNGVRGLNLLSRATHLQLTSEQPPGPGLGMGWDGQELRT